MTQHTLTWLAEQGRRATQRAGEGAGRYARPLAAAVILPVLVACSAASEQPAADQPPARMGLILDIASADGRLVAVGEHGRVAVTDGDGDQWSVLQSPEQAVLTAVSFVDGSHGWAVGHGGVILRSADGGLSWQPQQAADAMQDPFFDVLFLDRQVGLAVGAFGTIQRTEDGGASWQSVGLAHTDDGMDAWDEDDDWESAAGAEDAFAATVDPADAHVYAITCLPAPSCDVLFTAGEAGTVLRSADAGVTWEVVETPDTTTWFGIIGQGDRLLAFGMFGRAMASKDGGQTWAQLESGTRRPFFAASWLGQGSAVLVGDDGIWRRYDGGDRLVAPRAGRSKGTLTSILAPGRGEPLVGGEGGIHRLRLSAAESQP